MVLVLLLLCKSKSVLTYFETSGMTKLPWRIPLFADIRDFIILFPAAFCHKIIKARVMI